MFHRPDPVITQTAAQHKPRQQIIANLQMTVFVLYRSAITVVRLGRQVEIGQSVFTPLRLAGCRVETRRIRREVLKPAVIELWQAVILPMLDAAEIDLQPPVPGLLMEMPEHRNAV